MDWSITGVAEALTAKLSFLESKHTREGEEMDEVEAGRRTIEASWVWRLREEVEREKARLGQREEEEAAAICTAAGGVGDY